MLGNAYKEYCAADEENRERVVRHWVRNWFSLLRDMPEEFEDVRPDLLPIVRARSHFELNQLRSMVETGTPISWPYVPLGEHFGVALVYDLPDAMRSIPQANLDAWGLTLYEAMEFARQNLASSAGEVHRPAVGQRRLPVGHGRQLRRLADLVAGADRAVPGRRRSGGHDRQSRQLDRRRRGR